MRCFHNRLKTASYICTTLLIKVVLPSGFECWSSKKREKTKKRKGRKITTDFVLIVFVLLSWRALRGEHGSIFLTVVIRKDQRVRPLHV